MEYKIKVLNTNIVNGQHTTLLAILLKIEHNISKYIVVELKDGVQSSIKIVEQVSNTISNEELHYLYYILDKWLINSLLQ